MTATVTAYRGRSVYVLDGCAAVLQSYDAELSPEAREEAQRVVAFGAALEVLACRLRWTGTPRRVSA